jgi:DNA-binding response OmpR family regulator
MEDFKHLSVLIIDPSGHSKKLFRTILASIGVQRIWPVSHTDAALSTLRGNLVDIVFCGEEAGPLHPDSFVKALRCDLSTTNVTVPVVLISAGTNRSRVSAWRDAGGSDVIVTPVSPETVKLRLQSLTLAPKPFVTTKVFIGPDRRSGSDERRQFGERRPLIRDRRTQSAEGIVFPLTLGHPVDPAKDGP